MGLEDVTGGGLVKRDDGSVWAFSLYFSEWERVTGSPAAMRIDLFQRGFRRDQIDAVLS